MKWDDYQCIQFERRQRVLVIRLNRPDQLNAIDGRLHTELARVFTDAATDPESDVIVLTGNGKAFCAGGDLDWMQSSIDRPAEFEAVAAEAKAIRWTKITANLPLKQLVHSHFDAGVAYEMLSNMTADHKEAVAAFRERRDAVFTGN